MSELNKIALKDVNEFHQEEFISTFGEIFEKSAWIAKEVWTQKPFENKDAMFHRFCEVLTHSSDDQKFALLRAHPELGTNKKMTDFSTSEQKGAGLTEAEDKQITYLAELNKKYHAKFSFPFIIAVKGLKKEDIIKAIEIRLNNDKKIEFDECIDQVKKIARFRFDAII